MATLLPGNPPRADVSAAAFQSGKRLAASALFKWFCSQATQQQCQRGYNQLDKPHKEENKIGEGNFSKGWASAAI